MTKSALTFILMLLWGCDPNLKSLDETLLKSGPKWGQTPEAVGLPFEEVLFPTSEGKRLMGWYIPSTSGSARAIVLIHTGMQGNMAEYMPYFSWFSEGRLDTFIYDWQGFGDSEGQRLFVHFESDTYSAVNYLMSRPEPAAKAMIQFGVSLGSAAALGAAAFAPDSTIGVMVYGAFEPAALPADYLFLHYPPLLASMGVFYGAVFSQWATPFLSPQTHLDQIRAPILAVIAEDDTTVPPDSQLRLFDRYPEPKAIVYTFGDHIAAHRTDPDLGNKIVHWIDGLPGLLPVN